MKKANPRVDPLGKVAEGEVTKWLDSCLTRAGELVSGMEDGPEKHDKMYEYMQDFGIYFPAKADTQTVSQRVTAYIDHSKLMEHDQILGQVVSENYYRLDSYILSSVRGMSEMLESEEQDKRIVPKCISIFNLPKIHSIRDLRTDSVGKLVAISGTVTRSSEIKPELLTGVFKCGLCQQLSNFVEQEFVYTTPLKCTNAACLNLSKWHLDLDKSIFCDWQKLRVQENSDEIPSGCMPRTIDVMMRHDAVDRCKAGDKVTLCGTLVVIPETGKLMKVGERRELLRMITEDQLGQTDSSNPNPGLTGLKDLGVRALNFRLAFLATVVYPNTETNPRRMVVAGEDADGDPTGSALFTEAERAQVDRMRSDPHILENLCRCIAPNIWGHPDIKRGLTLMLFGGVQKRTVQDRLPLRGDINVLLVGDPSVGKSQFLKFISKIIPRTVYTSGKASSAAGLTASVVKDPDTKSYNIEVGALMLADNAICCIDEFDKMDNEDQVAIHEAMEQQTISIAKAGIKATLNSRTSILAAANPIGGRYDPRKPLKQNVNLTSPILSRFDLFFVITDSIGNVQVDDRVANHILDLHIKGEMDFNRANTIYSSEDFVLFRRYAKQQQPRLTPEAIELIAHSFRDMRQRDKANRSVANRLTTRRLESIIRLSEAVARIYCSSTVLPEHVDRALSVLSNSMKTLDESFIEIPYGVAGTDNIELRKIPLETYRRIEQVILYRLRSLPETELTAGVERDQLIRWVLDDTSELEESSLVELSDTAKQVVNQMIREEKLVDKNQYEKGSDDYLEKLTVNVNLP